MRLRVFEPEQPKDGEGEHVRWPCPTCRTSMAPLCITGSQHTPHARAAGARGAKTIDKWRVVCEDDTALVAVQRLLEPWHPQCGEDAPVFQVEGQLRKHLAKMKLFLCEICVAHQCVWPPPPPLAPLQ